MNIEYRCKCGNKLEVDQVKPKSYGYDVEVILEQCDMCAAQHRVQLTGLYCPHCGDLHSDHLITERGGACVPPRN